MMRHAYSGRLAIAAKLMGHSTAVHGSIYANFFNERHSMAAFERQILNK